MNRVIFGCGCAFLIAALTVTTIEEARGQDVSPTRFVGDWVGLQSWAGDDAPPNAREPQPVEIKIQLIEGALVGTITPFMGGSDGASFIGGTIAGEALKASGAMGPPRAAAPGGAARPQRGGALGWKSAVRVDFHFVASGNANQLAGTVEVKMGDVKWMQYKYELNKKRSRY